MKLYEVTVEYTTYVVADDEREAHTEAERYAHEDSPAFINAVEVTKGPRIDPAWRDSIPYGEHHGDRTCLQIVEELYPEPPYEDPNQMKLPGADKWASPPTS